MKNINYDLLKTIGEQYGSSFYILDSEQFRKNYIELQDAFRAIYPNSHIAYSYKTNYTPKLCKIVDELGGYAEIVSDMEYEIAKRIGVDAQKIIFNGPYKNYQAVEEILLAGGTVNLDSAYEIPLIRGIAQRHSDTTINIGIRCNFPINDNVTSRFGFDIDTPEFSAALSLTEIPNIHMEELHCHFASRRLDTWAPRARKMLELIDRLGITPEHIDLGGGLFGKMNDSLKAQFDSYIPNYSEYASEVATLFAEHFTGDYQPMLFIEPGSALVGDAMKFASPVVNIKTVGGKPIATLLGSIYNINPTLNKKNPPITVYSASENRNEYSNLDFGGFTCIESDYLYRDYNGRLSAGDYVVFDNVGSYSIVLKPPFILPNFAVVDLSGDEIELIKQPEVFDDLFHTFVF